SINKINVDSKAMRNVLKQISVLDKTNILLKRKKIKSALKDILVILILPLRKCIICSFHLLIFKIFFKHKIKLPKHPITLIDTYALPGYYSKDRYYNGLWTALNATEKKGIYFVPTIVMTKWNKMFSAYKELINADRQFIFKEKYLKFTDIIYVALYPIRIQFFKTKSTLVNNIDYSSLISGDLRKRGSYGLAIEGLINYRFIKRLKKNKFKIYKFIDWWESQTLDKGLHKALNDFYPDVPVVGYLGYAPRDLELQLYPTKYELNHGVVPKKIAVIGKGFIDGLKIFNLDHEVDYAPAFRFQHLWNGEPHSTDKTYYTILIAFPITIDDSVHIIEQVIACIDEVSMKSLRFWVKPHPTMLANKLKREFGSIWPKSFEFIDI
ncbi:MAG: hypothetical protein QF864_15285, partial [SAR202 cluster bacterium]|nr:hypothetical protein [SAR202 cluster bacterium]